MIGGGYYWYGIPQSPISIKEYIYNYMYVLPEKYLKGSKAATARFKSKCVFLHNKDHPKYMADTNI